MRIVTYNFAHRKKEQWSKLFDDFSPDIILAQEARDPQKDIAELYQAQQGRFFYRAVHNQWGSALFIRQGEIKWLELPEFEGWVVGAEIDHPDWQCPLRVFSLHVPIKKGSSYIKQLHLILDKIAQLPDDAELIIGGDFNVTASFRHPGEAMETGRANEKVLARLRSDFGLTSCWQAAHPDQPLAQTLRWVTNRTTPYHCDGIFAPVAWSQLLESCEVISEGWEALSDHNPVVATFELPKMETI
jgi:endonuclease/exonuclease/phosphatase family metal-dependent hydrolase